MQNNNVYNINDRYIIIRKPSLKEWFLFADFLQDWDSEINLKYSNTNSPMDEIIYYNKFIQEYETKINEKTSTKEYRSNKVANSTFPQRWTQEKFDINKIRKIEPKIDSFLPEMIDAVKNDITWYMDWEEADIIKKYFTLDNIAINRLKDNWYSKYLLDFKDRLFENLEISTVIAENLWNSLYSTLASFLLNLWAQLQDDKILQASSQIQKARKICEKYMDKNNLQYPHDSAEKWISENGWIDHILHKLLQQTEKEKSEFLNSLSEKLRTDADKDLYNGREKLADCLYLASSFLKKL